MRAGQFRGDFYYRLHVVPFNLPPLRERREDVAMLAQHFLRRQSRVHTCRIDAEALALLRAYPWPGNIRELKKLERMAVLGGPLLTACDVSPEIVRCW